MIQTSKMLLHLAEKCGFSIADPDDALGLRVRGMNFTIHTYTAPKLGHISVMKASGFFGLMKMDTLIITPTQKDMPLFSYDRVLAMGNDTLIFELYDTLLGQTDLSALENVKEAQKALPDHDLGKHWYDSIKLPQSLSKKGKKKDSAAFDAAADAYLSAYIQAAASAAPSEAEAKREKAAVYVEGLLTHGGPSTDVFKKGIGDEETARLFRKILFATEA